MIECSDEERWRAAIDECDDIQSFNKYITPTMRTRGDLFKLMAATEAKKRGYRADKTAGVYLEPAMRLNMRLTKGRNIIRVDWQGGTLYVEFGSSSKVYEYPNCPEAWCDNLLKSPYPDHLWGGYKEKIDAAAKASQEIPLSGVS